MGSTACVLFPPDSRVRFQEHMDLLSLVITLVCGLVLLGLLLLRARSPRKLDPNVPHEYKVIDRREVQEGASGEDIRPTVFLTFTMPRSKDLPCGSHVKLSATINGEKVERSYTPTRFDGNQCELLFRVYPEGKLSRKLGSLQVGDTVSMRGPTGIHRYGLDGPGTFRQGSKRIIARNVGLVAGGTGITPMLQIANAAMQDPTDNTPMRLVAFNSTPDDVMLYDRLNSLADGSEDQLRLHWIVSKDTVVCLCGPPGFNQAAKKALADLGYSQVLTW